MLENKKSFIIEQNTDEIMTFFPFHDIECIYNVMGMKTTKKNDKSIGLNPKHKTNESKQKYKS